MQLAVGTFRSWAEDAHRRAVVEVMPFSWTAVSHAHGSGQSTLSMQRSRGYVRADFLLAYARSLGLDPIAELAAVGQLRLLRHREEPTGEELLGLIPLADLLREALYRMGERTRPVTPGEPRPAEFRRWLSAGPSRSSVSGLVQALGMTAHRYARKNRTGQWDIGELHRIAEVTGLSMRGGMYAAGWISWEETGFAAPLRGEKLHQCSDSELYATIRTQQPVFEKAADQQRRHGVTSQAEVEPGTERGDEPHE